MSQAPVSQQPETQLPESQGSESLEPEAAEGRKHLRVFFVHDEICVVSSTHGPVDDERREAIHESVRAHLNTAIFRVLHRQDDNDRDEDDRDKDEKSFRRHLIISDATREALLARTRDEQLLWPLARRPTERASLAFDRRDGSTTLLHFYNIGPPEGREKQSPEERDAINRVQDGHLRELVLFANHEFAQRPVGRSVQGGWHIVASTPNWLVGASDEEHGSPGAPPEPVLPPPPSDPTKRGTEPPNWPNWRFRFDGTCDSPDQSDPAHPKWTLLQGMVEKDRQAAESGDLSNVVVAVLDTSPSLDAVMAAMHKFTENSLLQRVVGQNPVRIDGSLSLDRDDFLHLTDIIPDWQGHSDRWDQATTDRQAQKVRDEIYAMPDHGLFAAGIVKDIAPSAEIHLIRVMDDTGMADLLNVMEVLSVLPCKLLCGDCRRLIINLSLTFSVPTLEEFHDEWLPQAAKNEIARNVGRYVSDIHAIHQSIHRSLGDVIAWLGEKQVLIVAAAGNYYREGTPRPAPRFPANYDDVLDNVVGVAAFGLDDKAASYSNLAEARVVRTYSHGIATLGGDTTAQIVGKPRVQGIPPEGDRPQESVDSIRGIFSAVNLPFKPTYDSSGNVTTQIGIGSNQTGWVYWVGTSFATPIITAIAAIVWGDRPCRSLKDVIDRLQYMADLPLRRMLNCDGIHAYQEDC